MHAPFLRSVCVGVIKLKGFYVHSGTLLSLPVHSELCTFLLVNHPSLALALLGRKKKYLSGISKLLEDPYCCCSGPGLSLHRLCFEQLKRFALNMNRQ